MPSNDGKDAETAWLRAKTGTGAIVERLWDAADLRGRNGGRKVADFPKPSDFIVSEDSGIHYAEVKSCQGGVSFPFSNIKPKQRATALSLAARGRGHQYIFYIFSYALGRWFTLNGTEFSSICDAGKSSAKFESLTQWHP